MSIGHWQRDPTFPFKVIFCVMNVLCRHRLVIIFALLLCKCVCTVSVILTKVLRQFNLNKEINI